MTAIEPVAANTAIWDPVIRDDVSLNKFTTAKINELRAKLLVPGQDVQLLKIINTVVPILLVQRPGSTDSNVRLSTHLCLEIFNSKTINPSSSALIPSITELNYYIIFLILTDYGSGWDIIIPANWAMPVWLSLILSGAKPGGLRESKTINFESKIMPDLPPDSQAGHEHYREIETSDRDRYFK